MQALTCVAVIFILLAVVAGIVFTTVYLSLHYVVDLVAGAALAILVPAIVPVLRRVFGSPDPGSAIPAGPGGPLHDA